MSDYNSLLSNVFNTSSSKPIEEVKPIISNNTPILFTINDFLNNVTAKSLEKNQNMFDHSLNISAYDLAKNCIKEVVLRLLKYPIEITADNWLPLLFRATLGSAIHEFVQQNFPFTETEVSMKVPSLRTSVRIDCLLNDDILVEIKSLPFKDYETVIKSNKPRRDDFIQTIVYKYLLENYLEEIKSVDVSQLRTKPPKLDKYNISKIQFIYVAHDLLCSDVNTISEAFEIVDNLKKLLNSKKNQFYFLSVLTIDLNTCDISPFINFIYDKITKINYYVSNNIIPSSDDPYISNNCYFCRYNKLCKNDLL